MSTLRELIDDGYRIAVSHEVIRLPRPCSHGSWLDLEALARKYGDDFDLAAHREWFFTRLRCTACNRKGNMTWRVHPDTGVGSRRPMGAEAGE